MKMAEVLTGVEASAVKLLKRAIELEQCSKFQPALVCYQEGIDLLMDVLKGCQDSTKRKHYRDKLEEYMGRAERVKLTVSQLKAAGKYHEQLKIEENSTGHGYANIFGPYLDETVKEVWVEDAYIRSFHQINNFLRLCELLVTQCKNLQHIHLKTSADDHNQSQQTDNLAAIKGSLATVSINFQYCLTALHDREIRLDNGWIIKIGRGLDYFKRVEKFCLGFHDMNLRPCHSTTVDVFHSKHTKDR